MGVVGSDAYDENVRSNGGSGSFKGSDYSDDFSSFSKSHTDVKTNNCTIMLAQWERKGHEYIFTIKANRFLRNMVRAITGTLLEAGKGKLDEERLRAIILARDRRLAGISVPGHALFLEEIEYPLSVFLEQSNS
jgi:tRNA pseudouridine38-40 synthase